jgi:DNA helicase-2/ATP-dependent DNA helicase PcrA
MREPSRFIGEIPKENIVFESQHLEPYGYRNTSITNLADLKKEISGSKICDEFDSKYNVGDYVIHSKFGEGRVKNIERDKILIYFPNVGEKKFLTSALETILTKA